MVRDRAVTVSKLKQELIQSENSHRAVSMVGYDNENNRFIVTGWIERAENDPEFALTLNKVDQHVQPLGKRITP